MALRGIQSDKIKNPYGVTQADSNHVNAAWAVGGDVLPLINLIVGMIDTRNKPAFEHLGESQRVLLERVEALEMQVDHLTRQVSYLTSISHIHTTVNALPPPTLPSSRSVLEGEEPPEGENNDSWASQEEHKDDIKF